MELKDKKVMVIGGSSGMGLAIAKATAAVGAKVVITGRSAHKLEDALAEITCLLQPHLDRQVSFSINPLKRRKATWKVNIGVPIG